MSLFFSNYSPRGVAASMSRDGEEWPLSWELRSHAAPSFIGLAFGAYLQGQLWIYLFYIFIASTILMAWSVGAGGHGGG
ncbi:hypothetical protein GSUB_00260 [Geoalkalibacter subterraneus]|uniref:Uncharacterized protein n=1 Tax=Geoalkalibacter subterraneus TaxID=483547 RepID=A0A0B5FMW8_9BACT|nr:hypothetical protein GSUB_00260 [Geoalkalibacter subterraneus]